MCGMFIDGRKSHGKCLLYRPHGSCGWRLQSSGLTGKVVITIVTEDLRFVGWFSKKTHFLENLKQFLLHDGYLNMQMVTWKFLDFRYVFQYHSWGTYWVHARSIGHLDAARVQGNKEGHSWSMAPNEAPHRRATWNAIANCPGRWSRTQAIPASIHNSQQRGNKSMFLWWICAHFLM